MARRADKERARILRAKGKSYSEIKELMGVGKGTLSVWLRDMPLSAEQIRSLRALHPRRIERFRATMQRKRDVRLASAYTQVQKDIGHLSKRDLFIAGIYLYWGEGTKADRGNVAVANTNPAVIRVFLAWLECMNVPCEKVNVRLHLYADMDIEKETNFWSSEIGIPVSQFRKPYVKKSTLTGLTYKNGYGHGTCNVRFENIAMWEYITMALKYVEERHRP